MERLEVYLLGEPQLRGRSGVSVPFPTRKSVELLAVAVLSRGRTVPRSQLAARLRCDQDEGSARKALSTDLWRLRRVIKAAGFDSDKLMVSNAQSIGFRADAPVWCDAEDFRDAAEVCRSPLVDDAALAPVSAAAELYRGDLLHGFEADEWLLLREHFRGQFAAMLDRLMQFEVSRDRWRRALRWAEALIEHDPLLEHAHRTAMQCHFLMGNRGAAIRQFNQCAEFLMQEIGVEPAPETIAMYRGLLTVPQPTRQPESVVAPPRPVSAAVPAATDRLAMALGNLETASSLIRSVDRELREPS